MAAKPAGLLLRYGNDVYLILPHQLPNALVPNTPIAKQAILRAFDETKPKLVNLAVAIAYDSPAQAFADGHMEDFPAPPPV